MRAVGYEQKKENGIGGLNPYCVAYGSDKGKVLNDCTVLESCKLSDSVTLRVM